MAVVRARSAPPYALFTAIFLCVVFAAAAIVMYVMWSGSQDELTQRQKQLDRIASGPDLQMLQGRYMGGANNEPAVHRMQGELDALKTMIAGAESTSRSAEDIKSDPDLKPVLDKYSSLKAGVKALVKDNSDKEASLARAQAQVEAAGKRAIAAEKQLSDQLASDEQKIADLQAQLNRATQGVAAANQRADQTTAQSQATIQQIRDSEEELRKQLVGTNRELQSKLDEANKQIAELKIIRRNQMQGPDTLVGEADGEILSVNAVAKEVYINLTSKDRIVAGMTFTAYDPRTGVRYGSDEAALGDGSIEVMAVGPESSRCRITRVTPGHTIQANDLIANVVYHNDKTRQTRFVIFGDFDLDGDGNATPAERDRLASMIISWGGVVENQVTAQTDYLVLGARPASPTVVEDTTTAPAAQPGSILDQRSKEQNRYDDLRATAISMGIPVLNANRFLSMIGYYNTTIVRY